MEKFYSSKGMLKMAGGGMHPPHPPCSGVRRIFQWGLSVTSHRDDVKILQLTYSSSEVLKCIGL